MLEPTREVGLKSLDFTAAPGPGQQARRGAEHTRQELFVERMLCALAMPFVQELACLVDAARDLLDCVAKFVAVEGAPRRRPPHAGPPRGHHLLSQVELVGGLVPQVALASGRVRLLDRGEGPYDLGAFGRWLTAAAVYGDP
ncbi:hypothetical protein ACFY5H_18550 [Streptomyces sp. NPDC013012]|uniref:hypothetical protein n=1 Tax=Streptomyces sp. NPDC013012 TaxID=3364860 RepID=UPI00367FD971